MINYEEHIGLVHHCAKKYRHLPRIEYADLIAVGTTGLWLASINYNKDKGVKFSTFASKCIFTEMYKYIKSTNVIQVPYHVRKDEKKIDELSATVGKYVYSLDYVYGDGNTSLKDIIVDKFDFTEALEEKEMIDKIANNNLLSPKEKEILYKDINLSDRRAMRVYNRAIYKLRKSMKGGEING